MSPAVTMQQDELERASVSNANMTFEAGTCCAREEDVLAACRAGDWSSFGWLVERYRRLVWAAVDSIIPGGAHNEDVVQECFVRAFEKLHSFRGRSAFSTWLYALSRNQALMHKRKHKHMGSTLSLEESSEGARALIEILNYAYADDQELDDPQQLHLQREREAAVGKLLSALPTDCREVILLFYSSGESYEDMATTLGLPLNTLKSRLHRARLRLREVAKQQGWIEGDV